ncbi:uncharacterized protein LOC129906942 [Episyrphus balteatus]|uniref:uncharacterized protein LOC129906942 n=1 Tax=Episyrphus balteatus TaxID=286459 RepID=UPI002486B4D1|nr:uncharacterized protein LOC129906942 [Episyrphus balteatus]
MAKKFRCLKCLKIIECPSYDRAILIKHIRTDHPEIDLPDDETMEYSEKEEPTPSKAVNNNQQHLDEIVTPPPPREQLFPDINIHMEETTIRSPELKPIYTRKYKITTPLTPRSPQKRKMYKTSIEKWRPAKGMIYCPKCGAHKKPIIKSRSEKLSYSTVGAACILTCWPLCFLPCFFQGPSRDYLHCAECHNFLGMYDKQRNCVRPNREFVEIDGCQEGTFKKSFENNRPQDDFRLRSEKRTSV